MRTKYLGVLVAGMLVVGACGSTQPSSIPVPHSATPPPAGASDQPPAPTATAPTSSAPSSETVDITVGTDTGAELKFDPAEVSVPAGANVRVTFENRAVVPHNLTFQGPPDVATATVVPAGTSESLEFTSPDPGEYPFECTLHPGMGGKLIVTGG